MNQPSLFHNGSYGETTVKPTPREVGEQEAKKCAANAESRGWDREGATAFVLTYLGTHGATLGETIVAAAMESFPTHDARAYGAIFSKLSRQGKIRKVSYATRTKGHGAPGIVWEAVE